ncbi:MAG TPA: MlaD family protein [Gemmatimonadaceae bacterium]|nr:MlaD family protein [Gemmatimonadaceae bacterium]
MARRLAWSDVRGGLVAMVAIVALAVATMKFARVGALHGDTIRVYAVVGEARGILKGSEVWLLGQKIGNVTGVHFRSPATSDTSTRLVLEMEVLDQHREALRRDAVAQIRSGGTVIGAAVVYLSPGTPGAPPLLDRDTIRAQPQADAEGGTAQLDAVTREFPNIVANAKVLREELGSTQGTAGAMLNDGRERTAALQRLGAQLSRLRRRVTNGRGSVRAATSGDAGARARLVLARADSVRALMASPNTSLGRFRRDSTLAADVADIRDQAAAARTALATSSGTAGRVLHDSAVFDALADVHREMAALVADLKKHPLRYNPF